MQKLTLTLNLASLIIFSVTHGMELSSINTPHVVIQQVDNFTTVPILPMNLDNLPADTLGDIVVYLADNVDHMPPIIYSAKALSLVNHQIYDKLNSNPVTLKFAHALATQFNIKLVDAMGALNTAGAYEYFREYVQSNGDYEQFKILQQILAVAREVNAEFRSIGLKILEINTTPCAYYHQTKQGFFIKTGSGGRTSIAIATPWGHLDISHVNGSSEYAVTQALLKQFKTSFIKVKLRTA